MTHDALEIDSIFNSVKTESIYNVCDDIIIDTFKQFIKVLRKGKIKFSQSITKETGKPIKFSLSEVDRCISIIEDAISYLLTHSSCSGIYSNSNTKLNWYKRKLPIGLVLGFTPFSSPYSSFIHKLVACLVYKNNFILKPSPKALNCSLELYNLLKNNCADEIKNSFNILPFSNDLNTINILNRKDYDCILFTGKSSTAKEIKKVIGRKLGIFETGSSAMAYVGDTADIQVAVTKILKGAFNQTGMRCVATKNVFINKKISNIFISALLENVTKVKSGSALDSDTDVGPIFDNSLFFELVNYISLLSSHNYEIIYGGKVINDNIIEPTILLDKNSNYYSVHEAYGPILCLHIVDDLEEIPDIYFKRSSLNVALYSNCIKEVNRWLNISKSSGSIFINHGPTERIDFLGFGGMFDENEGKEGIYELKNVLSKEQIIFTSI